MTHSFLLQPGRWSVSGHFRQKQQTPMIVRGFITITWKQEYWFKMISQLTLNNEPQSEIICIYKGHLDQDKKSYTYVLQHSILGNIEGEGWITSQSVIQYHWIVGASKKCTGIDTFYLISEDVYHLTSVILESHSLNSAMEATLKYLI